MVGALSLRSSGMPLFLRTDYNSDIGAFYPHILDMQGDPENNCYYDSILQGVLGNLLSIP